MLNHIANIIVSIDVLFTHTDFDYLVLWGYFVEQRELKRQSLNSVSPASSVGVMCIQGANLNCPSINLNVSDMITTQPGIFMLAIQLIYFMIWNKCMYKSVHTVFDLFLWPQRWHLHQHAWYCYLFSLIKFMLNCVTLENVHPSHTWLCIRQVALRWCHNGRDSVSNHQHHYCDLGKRSPFTHLAVHSTGCITVMS